MELYIVDAFTGEPFRGNPAGVVLLDQPRDDAWMQSVAAEMRHSETAFVTPMSPGVAGLRWFTPTVEVDLCGHATLATGHVLGGDNVFHTRSGELRTSVGADGWVRMDFPADPPRPIPVGDDLRSALGDVAIVQAAQGVSDILVQVATAGDVREVDPDLEALERLPVRGVIVTAPGDDGSADVMSRCFYPAAGVPEDPVTGSAHCTIGSWWGPLLGREEFTARQLSERGGFLRISLRNDRVGLAGQAVTVLKGQIEV
jgi:predicted PhzF superfamily epimerase YddE/YHI9